MSYPHVVDASERRVPKSPVHLSSSNFVSPEGSASGLDAMGIRPGITSDEKFDVTPSHVALSTEQITQIPIITGWLYTSQLQLEDLRLG